MNTGEYSVCQFFPSGGYDYDVRKVDAETAVKRAKELSESVGAQVGLTYRIIITDAGDNTVFAWEFGRGVVFPPRPFLPSETHADRMAYASGDKLSGYSE